MAELQSLLEPVALIACRAGQRILEIYGTDFTVAEKADRSPLTAADMAAHDTILEGLAELDGGIPILSEESARVPFAERSAWPEFWLVDPLDGTREFIRRNGEFTVNICLVRAHEPVLGVVHVPVRARDYFACRGYGAFRREAGAAARRITVSRCPDGPIRVVGSRSHRGHSLEKLLARLGPHELIPMGSSLKFCIVAEGGADLYPRLGPTSEWDTAAPQAIVECAGGHVRDLEGSPLRYNAREEIRNPHFLVYGDASRDWVSYL